MEVSCREPAPPGRETKDLSRSPQEYREQTGGRDLFPPLRRGDRAAAPALFRGICARIIKRGAEARPAPRRAEPREQKGSRMDLTSSAAAPRTAGSTSPKILERLNGRWHERALHIFMGVVLAHWAEHLAQAFQIYGLGWPVPQARGVL